MSTQHLRRGKREGTLSSCWAPALGFQVVEHLGRGATKERQNPLETHRALVDLKSVAQSDTLTPSPLMTVVQSLLRTSPMSRSQAPRATCHPFSIISGAVPHILWHLVQPQKPFTDHLNFLLFLVQSLDMFSVVPSGQYWTNTPTSKQKKVSPRCSDFFFPSVKWP